MTRPLSGMSKTRCGSRAISLADPLTKQPSGMNACGGRGTKGTKLCDQHLEGADGTDVTLLTEDW